MATRSGQKAPGKRDRGAPASETRASRSRLEDQTGMGAAERDPETGFGTGEGSGPTFAEVALRQQPDRQGGEDHANSRGSGPRRVLIFAKNLKEASAIAKKKGYPRELWRFVTGPADTDVDPREWATITVVGFGKDRPFAKDAYDLFQARCRGFGIKAPSYDP